MGRIRVLSAELINQIAAGEVVERPASVVKELAENSVDAGAGTVRIELVAGGMQAIRVIDDGTGMSKDDALLAMQRHATSKLADAAGLFQIFTKGFRGEALPAIASVSRFNLHTSEPGAATGARLLIDGGAELRVEDAAPAGGTRIEVADLFFNVPARRKFLRREQTELVHCEEAVIRLALAHWEVGFFLEHEGRSLFAAPPATSDPTERIAVALGPEVHPHLLAVDEARLSVRVTGWVASAEYTQSSARGLYTFVNRRYIRDRGVNFAIQRAFQDSLPPGRQPVAVLFIEVDPSQVDVNVHPQKLEVRFADARAVQEALVAGISKALKGAPWREGQMASPEQVAGSHYAMAVDRFLAQAQAPGAFLQSPSPAWPELSFGQARPGINEAPPPGYFGQLKFLGELARRFWICEGQGGTLVVIDPRAALERLRLHQLLHAFDRQQLSSHQPSLFSATVELPPAELALVTAGLPVLAELGLVVEPFGGSTVAVRGVPPMLEGADLARLLVELAPMLGGAPDRRNLLKIFASHAAERESRSFSHEEAHALLGELDEADFSVTSAHPTVVVWELPLLELQRRTEP
jgi:DNA mismatch repair protein MutL